jgi:hypothetical protein
MIIPIAELEEVKVSGNFYLKCPRARVQLATFGGRPNKIYLIEIDALGNAKKSKEYVGEVEFWNATRDFESIIAERLGLRDVAGFEIGMVVQLQQNLGAYRKGDVLMVTEVNSEGQATQYQRLNKKNVERIKKSSAYSKLAKSSDKDVLNALGIVSVNAIDAKAEYEAPSYNFDEIVLENTTSIGNYSTNDLATLKPSKGGGVLKIQGFSFDKNENGKYVISAFGNFEDGAVGRVPLKDFKKK